MPEQPSSFADRHLEERGWRALDFQIQTWEAMREGRSGLLHSSTGSGKTLAVWLGYQNLAKDSRGLKAIWLTPLRALANDTLAALQGASRPGWRIEARTGDTGSSVKVRQLKSVPDALVTTPESLSLLLSQPDPAALLSGLELVVVDEWHELLSTKRGVQTELALARLRTWNPNLMVWGLSATLGNTRQAAEVLVPEGDPAVVQGPADKNTVIDSLLPESVERFPWAGHMGLRMVQSVAAELDGVASALVFTNTRAQAEIWYQELLGLRPEWTDQIGLHHGSLDLEARRSVETGLKEGRLRAVVATSSLDLGVDFSPVERVFQIGSPKGVARLLQRAGRSGHRPGEPSRVTCVPTHALELIEIAAARQAAEARRIEARPPLTRPLDVLTQHLVTAAVGGGFEGDELLAEVRRTHAFRGLSDEEWRWALEFVSQGGRSLAAYPEYQKVVGREGRWVVEDRRVAQRHRMNVGTIVSDAAISVQYMKGGRIGSVEESFVARLRKGDRFVFGGRALEFVQVKDMTCWVRRASSTKGVVPRWSGGRMPLSNQLAESARQVLRQARDGEATGSELALAAPMLAVQARWSAIPGEEELLVEQVRSREGRHLFLYPFEGRLVHEGLGALLAFRLSRGEPATFSVACNDYGVELTSAHEVDLTLALAGGLLTTEGVTSDILASLNATEMARRQFREIARVSGLVLQSAPGLQKTARQLQVSSGLLFDVFSKYDPDHPLLGQAQREVLERNLEESRLIACLRRLSTARLVLTAPPRITPFGFPIVVDRLRETVSSETLTQRIERMVQSLERAAG